MSGPACSRPAATARACRHALRQQISLPRARTQQTPSKAMHIPFIWAPNAAGIALAAAQLLLIAIYPRALGAGRKLDTPTPSTRGLTASVEGGSSAGAGAVV